MSDFRSDVEEATKNRLAALQRDMEHQGHIRRLKPGTYLFEYGDGKTLLDGDDIKTLIDKHEDVTVTSILRVATDVVGRVQPRMVAALVKPAEFAIILVAKK